jgi:peptidase M42 family hydrolase
MTVSDMSRAGALPPVDIDYITDTLLALLAIPSPTGYTDQIVHWTGEELQRLGIDFELTRRGAIRADFKGRSASPDRAVVAHLDTLGAMVRELRHDGRLGLAPIGTWSSRFAEGCRVTICTEPGVRRGTILPRYASGHAYNQLVDTQTTDWDHLEVRLDEIVFNQADLIRLGLNVGDFVAIDAAAEITESGFINSRHLDDKAGVAVLLGTAKAVKELGEKLPVDCHLIFTISEEVGSGSSHTLHGDVAEMVTIDNAVQAPNQNSSEFGVTIAMMDSSGPFDWHLTHKLLRLCEEHGIPHRRDVFRHYSSDSASAVDAGNDLRTALACFGVDASHGYERTHKDALRSLAILVAQYMRSAPTFLRDRRELAPLDGFPTQPMEPAE